MDTQTMNTTIQDKLDACAKIFELSKVASEGTDFLYQHLLNIFHSRLQNEL